MQNHESDNQHLREINERQRRQEQEKLAAQAFGRKLLVWTVPVLFLVFFVGFGLLVLLGAALS